MTVTRQTQACKVADAYAETRQDGYSSAGAYDYARHIASTLTPTDTEYLDDPGTGQYPTVRYTFADGSRARVMFGGVSYAD